MVALFDAHFTAVLHFSANGKGQRISAGWTRRELTHKAFSFIAFSAVVAEHSVAIAGESAGDFI